MRPVAVFCFSISICALSALAQWVKTRQQQGKHALNSVCQSVRICLSVCLSVHPSVCPSVCLPFCLSVSHLCMCERVFVGLWQRSADCLCSCECEAFSVFFLFTHTQEIDANEEGKQSGRASLSPSLSLSLQSRFIFESEKYMSIINDST